MCLQSPAAATGFYLDIEYSLVSLVPLAIHADMEGEAVGRDHAFVAAFQSFQGPDSAAAVKRPLRLVNAGAGTQTLDCL